MIKFTKGFSAAKVLPSDTKMTGKVLPLGTDTVQFNKNSMQDLDKVLDQIELTPEQMAKLQQIIEACK